MPEDHLADTLAAQIKERYRPADVRALRHFLEAQGAFVFPAFANGLFPAVVFDREQDASGYSSVWVRDNVYVAWAHATLGETGVAARTVGTLLEFFRRHRWRFEAILGGRLDPSEPMSRPHVRFAGRTLTEIDQKWPHAQNDALGYLLWLLAILGREGKAAVSPVDLESVALLVLYLQALPFWQDEDSGHWEEQRKRSASSIGAVTAGLRSLQEWLLVDDTAARGCRYGEREIGAGLLDEMIQQGLGALAEILPAE